MLIVPQLIKPGMPIPVSTEVPLFSRNCPHVGNYFSYTTLQMARLFSAVSRVSIKSHEKDNVTLINIEVWGARSLSCMHALTHVYTQSFENNIIF